MSFDLLEGVVRIYNRGDKVTNDLIDGAFVTVPPHGSVETSAKRAKIALERHKGVLTVDACFAKQNPYTDADFKAIEMMDEVHLRSCLRVLMSGAVADIQAAYDEQKANANQSSKK